MNPLNPLHPEGHSILLNSVNVLHCIEAREDHEKDNVVNFV